MNRIEAAETPAVRVPELETNDFPFNDPWSVLLRKNIGSIAAERGFAGATIFEAGAGDARNAFAAGIADPENNISYVGVDLEQWRLELAEENLRRAGIPKDRYNLHEANVIDWLETNGNPGDWHWGIACLPQVPADEGTTSAADGYDPSSPLLAETGGWLLNGHSAETYGLTLNAAFLDKLRGKVKAGDFNLLIVLGGRVPSVILDELFMQTGWEPVPDAEAEAFVQQDPDTSTEYIADFEDPHSPSFYELNDQGLYVPLSASEAESRRRQSLKTADGDAAKAREALNVHHTLRVFQLVPAGGQMS